MLQLMLLQNTRQHMLLQIMKQQQQVGGLIDWWSKFGFGCRQIYLTSNSLLHGLSLPLPLPLPLPLSPSPPLPLSPSPPLPLSPSPPLSLSPSIPISLPLSLSLYLSLPHSLPPSLSLSTVFRLCTHCSQVLANSA